MHPNRRITSSSGIPQRLQVLLLLRWVLIVATSYLVLFSRPLSELPLTAAWFIAAYFGSNLLLGNLLPRLAAHRTCEVIIVLVDVVMVSIGLALTPTASSEFFVVYFLVLLLSALSERLIVIAAAALLVSATHLYITSQIVGSAQLLAHGYVLRIPFLFVVAVFFGYVVGDAHSRERQAEEARSRQLRAEFLSTTMHDVKNSLGVIQSLAVLLLEGDAGSLNPEQVDFVRRIHASTRHVIDFALNLIDAARIDAGELLVRPRPTQVADVIDDALQVARSASDLKGVTIRSLIEPGLPPLYVDAVHFERVISNLLGNAIKFTPAGGVVELSMYRRSDDLVLQVSDDGVGIPAPELANMFDKERWPAQRGPQGTGLGLSIVKAIVQAHAGRVEIASAVGTGTSVRVWMPLQPRVAAGTRTLKAARQRWRRLSPASAEASSNRTVI